MGQYLVETVLDQASPQDPLLLIGPEGPSSLVLTNTLTDEEKQNFQMYEGNYPLEDWNGDWVRIPSAGADMKVVAVKFFNSEGQVFSDIQMGTDRAGQFYVRRAVEREKISGHLEFTGAVPKTYKKYDRVSPPFRSNQPFVVEPLSPEIKRSLETIGIDISRQSSQEIIDLLVNFFSAKGSENKPLEKDQTILDSIVKSPHIACRHRAYAFTVIAKALGIEARYVESATHAFVHVRPPHQEWVLIDLGGVYTQIVAIKGKPRAATNFSGRKDENSIAHRAIEICLRILKIGIITAVLSYIAMAANAMPPNNIEKVQHDTGSITAHESRNNHNEMKASAKWLANLGADLVSGDVSNLLGKINPLGVAETGTVRFDTEAELIGQMNAWANNPEFKSALETALMKALSEKPLTHAKNLNSNDIADLADLMIALVLAKGKRVDPRLSDVKATDRHLILFKGGENPEFNRIGILARIIETGPNHLDSLFVDKKSEAAAFEAVKILEKYKLLGPGKIVPTVPNGWEDDKKDISDEELDKLRKGYSLTFIQGFKSPPMEGVIIFLPLANLDIANLGKILREVLKQA